MNRNRLYAQCHALVKYNATYSQLRASLMREGGALVSSPSAAAAFAPAV